MTPNPIPGEPGPYRVELRDDHYGGGGHRNASGFRVPHANVAPDGGPGVPA